MLLLCQLLLPCGLITGDQRAAFMYVCTPMYELRGVLVAQLMVQKFSHWGDITINGAKVQSLGRYG